MGAGDLGFQRDDACGLGGGVGVTGQLQQLGDVAFVGLAQIGHAAVLQVEVPVGHAQAALYQVRRVALGLQQVGRHPHAEQVRGVEIGGVEQVHVGAQGAAQGLGQRLLVGDGGNGLQFRLHRCGAARFDGGFVHEGGVVVADLAHFAIAGLGAFFHDRAGVGQGLLGDHIEAALAGAVGRDLRALDPLTVGEVEEVVACRDAAVHACRVEAEVAQLCFGGRAGDRRLRSVVGRSRGVLVAAAERKCGTNCQHQEGALQRHGGFQVERPAKSNPVPAGMQMRTLAFYQ
ncbi:hypothetical protein D3C71_972370 [compost metagenome]